MNEFKVKKGLIVQGSGSTVLDIQGSQGQLFSVTDSLSGSLFSVNDISGVPIMEVFSDNRVNLGTFNAEAIKVSGSFATMTGSLFGTASYALSSNSASFATTSSYTTAISGTVNYIPKFTANNTIGNSLIYDNGTNVGIGTTSPSEKLDVNGNVKSNSYKFYLPSSITAQPNMLIPKTDGSRPIWYNNSSVGNDLALKSDIDNIQIGGRNLFRMGMLGKILNGVWSARTNNLNIEGNKITVVSNPNDVFATTFNVKGREITISGRTNIPIMRAFINPYNSAGVKGAEMVVTTQRDGENFLLTYTLPVDTVRVDLGLGFYPFSTYGTYWVDNVKVEQGNKATDWTPAPEDQVSDWNTTDTGSFSYIKNKPTDDIAKGVQAYNWGNHAGLYIPVGQKGVANGVATLDASGLIPTTQLPSYIDDVIEAADLTALNALPAGDKQTGKIYVALDTNKSYRWSGSTFIYITSGAVDSVAGKTGVVTLVKGDVGLGNVDNTSDSTKSVASAAKLTTARTIGGVSFDGTANIDLPGVNAAGNQSTTGNAATATTLQTARTINGTSFNGSANITTANWGTGRTLTIGSTGKTVDGSGNVSWTLAEIGAQPAGNYAASSHTHDDRYLPYYASSEYSNLPAGWYTIAVNAGNRASGKFILRDTSSSNHQSTVFYATHHYGSYSDITVLINSRYSGNPFRYLRIKDGGTYDGAMLQVYLDQGSNTVTTWLLENIQAYGWIVKNWIADGTNPGDVSNFAALTEVPAQVDLDYAPQGGMITTGDIYGGGDTTQYLHLNTNNYNSYAPTLTGGNATGTWGISITGNAATATKLQTARTIGGVSFDGTANIDLPGVNTTGNQSTTGNAATATTLQTARTITIGATGKNFNGSANVAWTLAEIGAQAALTNPITGTATSGQVAFFNGTTTQTGTSYLFWDDTNKRLGIGTTSPSQKLSVDGNITLHGSQSTPQYIFANNDADDSGVVLKAGYSSGVYSQIEVLSNWDGTSNSGGKIAFHVGGNERLRIDPNGNVGIGTLLPVNQLHVSSATDGAKQLLHTLSSTNGAYTGLLFKVSAITSDLTKKGGIFFERTGQGGVGKLHFALNNIADTTNASLSDAKMTILPGGNVGIGTSTPSEKLEVDGGVRALAFSTPDGTANQALTADGGVFDLSTISTAIEVTKTELDNLISSSQLVKDSIYKISDVNPTLYGGTTIFLTAIENNKLSIDGYGMFYNPKYDKSIDGFGIVKDYVFWTSVGEQTESGIYNIGDRVIWGGKHWNCISPTLVDTKYIIDKFNLDTVYFEEIPFNETDYNVVYDEIKYDYEHDLIIERNEQNSNIVSFSYDSLIRFSYDYFEGDLTKDNFIKNFQWGNIYDYNLGKGIGNNEIKDSLNENINFSGRYQINLTFTDTSYQASLTFTDTSYQASLTFTNNSGQNNLTFTNNSGQSNLNFNGSGQNYLIFTNNSYQSNLTFTNNSSQYNLTFTNSGQSNLNFNGSDQSNLTFTNNSGQNSLNFNGSGQSNLNFNGSYQYNLTFTNSYQYNLTFTDNSYQNNLTFTNNSYQNNLTLTDNIYQDNLTFKNYNYNRGNITLSQNEVGLTFDNTKQSIKLTGVDYFLNKTTNDYIQLGDIQGTANYIPKFTGNSILGNSLIYDNGTSVGIGTTTTPSSYKLNVNGDTNINGTLTATVKSFIIDHPTKPNKKLQYGVLEGPEHSVYFRGKLKGTNKIILPDYWFALVNEETITVNITPIGDKQNIWVVTTNAREIIIESETEINCFYTVFAERKDIDKLVTEFDK